MKNSHRCPKCQRNRLLDIPRVNDRSGKQDTDNPVFLVSTPQRQGELLAMMCRGCGYTEFYVKNLETVQPAGRRAIEVNGPEAVTQA